ncbi:hypothetical protein Ocin01_15146 [Orchesella cincta]|uniref:Uncharacterized protein n=1 Tax=Orchesella cincta TaxID=48709 RepID=A0A1D2MEW5_ORCCI|nr:hypothetical protein Ocin01_15146 [Orchesella cincta]
MTLSKRALVFLLIIGTSSISGNNLYLCIQGDMTKPPEACMPNATLCMDTQSRSYAQLTCTDTTLKLSCCGSLCLCCPSGPGLPSGGCACGQCKYPIATHVDQDIFATI